MDHDLQKRVEQFNMLALPGQSRVMHMGLSCLVNDLWREIEKLKADLVREKNAYRFLDEALNSGDGVYRP